MCLSEPTLVNAVTEILLRDSFLENTLDILDDAMKKGMLDGGVHGELVARFLLTLAKDVLLNSDMGAAKITATSLKVALQLGSCNSGGCNPGSTSCRILNI